MSKQMLVYCEQRQLRRELLGGGRALAQRLGCELAAAVLADSPATDGDADDCLRCGAQRVYLASGAGLAGLEVEPVAATLQRIVIDNEVATVLVGATRRGKELAGRLAQKLAAGCVTDATAISVRDGRLVTERCALGGNTVATELIETERQVVAVRPRTFEPVPAAAEHSDGQVLRIEPDPDPPRVAVVESRPKQSEGVDLEQADVVVAVGRGLRCQDDLALVQSLAEALGGELGCTRSLSSEFGWLSEQRMIGISGKKCTPQLYLAVGLSGQVQHTAAVRASRVIVAINTDKSAPIMEMADYAVVGDLYQAVPKLTELLGQASRPAERQPGSEASHADH